MNELFPIYIKLDQVQTLVIGGGPVGLEKLEAILYNSPQAKVHLVAMNITDGIRKLIEGKTNIRLSERAFQEVDLNGIDLIIAASNNPVFNKELEVLAKRKNILLNIADKPDLCDFYLGSVVRKGNLKIGISTNGKSPTIAKRIKEFIDDVLPNEIDETLNLMHDLRKNLHGDFQEKIRVLNKHTEALIANNQKS
ncbi:bifunctional precorrin-2 dehydrogenase/sirohydrochlorin ferrochelatase [Sphingobacterium sp. UT-1RO-CII-1]|uniref:precorrin-2 dehydrogenase/sirohydrochlorin ferrochelatase family protein n=1 Tax=Sphingobacterium sp. UT-1RO-CII-1 TaxID=2995225 RepID=UPI00227CA8FE|nr:bifunctional precorrin-2 dehydrogenase/sirohydrochlorin ferrochelatase [Sphingobacterium sp. UT-1RO-CII-1]MCY4778932.1 bifunctional precorrin-2 dehydrogenase/sirohydrochlorin ferrochelatase [Sphingobacterium sp. UT-1RO-CII-1]